MGLTDSEETVQVSKGQTPLRHCNRDRDVVWAAFGSGRSRLPLLRGHPPPGRSGPAVSRSGPATGGPSPTRPWRPPTPSEDSCYLAHDGETDVDCRPVPSSSIRYDAELAAQLWDLSRSLTTVEVHRPIESFGKSRRMTNSVFRARRYDPYHAVVRGNELGWERSAISTGVREEVNGAAFRYHGFGILMNGIADPRGCRRKYLGNTEHSRGG